MNPEMVATFIGYGYTWIAIGSDMGFMVGRAQDWLTQARARVAAPSARAAG